MEQPSSPLQKPKLPSDLHASKLNPTKLFKSSLLADYNEVRAEAIPLTKATNHDSFMKYFKFANPDESPVDNNQSAKVSLWKLLSYSTWNERWLMILGIFMATFTGLGIPAWLVLLARSLDTFSNLAALIQRVGSEGLMSYINQELMNLCIAFAGKSALVLFYLMNSCV